MKTHIDFQRYPEYMALADKKVPVKGQVLLYGSSFFTIFPRADELLGEKDGDDPYTVINNGFGGSCADDLVYQYHRLVYPYAPRLMVIRTGVNDLCRGYSVEDSFLLTQTLCEWTRADFPECKIALLEIAEVPDKSLVQYRDDFKKLNALYRDYAAKNDGVYTFSITNLMYKDPSSVGTYENFKDIFRPDGLHHTEEGYLEIAPTFKKYIKKILAADPKEKPVITE